MTPRRSIIGAAIRKLLGSSGDIGAYPDSYWNNTVLAMRMNNEVDKHWSKTSLCMPMGNNADANFASVKLLMHFNGADTSQVFTDVTGKAITNTGSVINSTSEKKFGTASGYFNGSNYLSLASTSDFDFGSGAFTIEFWIYRNNSNACRALMFGSNGSADSLQMYIAADGGGYFKPATATNPTSGVGLYPGAIGVGSWHHVAMVWETPSIQKVYVNGVLNNSASGYPWASVARTLFIGVDPSYTPAGYLTGRIDDLRITKGVARYLGNFTPPSMSFADTATPSFEDLKAHAITLGGTPTLSSAQSKFGGYSALFNGTTDYLSLAASSDFGLTDKDFTIEAWVKTAAIGTVLDLRASATDYGLFYIATGGFPAHDTPTSTLTSSVSVTDNAWHHVVFCRVAGVLTIYVDGVVGAVAAANLYYGASRPVRVGATYTGASFFNGYLDDLRITKGIGRYVGEFTPPKTQMLTGTSIQLQDETGAKVVAANGNATTQSITKKYGNGAVYFDGTGDYLAVPYSTDLNISTGDFTVEGWLYPTNLSSNSGFYIYGDTSSNANRIQIDYKTDGSITFYIEDGSTVNNSANSATGVITVNNWYHIAAVQNGTNLSLFVNGVSVGTGTRTVTVSGTSVTHVGLARNGGLVRYCTGYIDDFRITKGIARYLSTFTPPSRELSSYGPPVAYDPYWDAVVLGMHMDGADNGVVFTDVKGKTVTASGNTCTKVATKKFGTASGYFDGSGDYLTVPTSADFDFGTGDFTVELYLNFAALPSSVLQIVGANWTNGWQIYYGGTASPNIDFNGGGGGVCRIKATPAINTWYHIVVCRVAGVVYGFVDGVETQHVTYSTSISSGGQSVLIGYHTSFSTYLNGYIDDLRITKGVGRYTSNFQPYQYAFPETRTPVRDVVDKYYDSVVLNMHMNGTNGSTQFIDEKGKAVTVVGNTNISTAQSKFGGASAYFDGAGDYLTVPDSPHFTFGAEDFSIEFFVYHSVATPAVLISKRNASVYPPFQVVLGANAVFNVSTTGLAWDATLTQPIQTGVMTHIYAGRSGSVLYLGVNGSVISTSVTGSLVANSFPLSIGAMSDGASPFTGYIDDVRITKGVGRYTSSFTIPTLPNPNFKVAPALQDPYWNSVVLSMNMEGTNGGTTFTDAKGHVITPNGSVVTSSAKQRFGSTSTYFDGTGDFLSMAVSADFDLSLHDFTIEAWVNVSGGTGPRVIVGKATTGNDCYFLYYNGADLAFIVSTNGIGTGYVTTAYSTILTIGTWYHVAVVRQGTVVTIFLNGKSVATNSSVPNFYNAANSLRIGSIGVTGYEYYWNGYIDDLRITKGVARYTTNFDVPTLPAPVVMLGDTDPYWSNVVLAMHMEGVNNGTSFPDSKLGRNMVRVNCVTSTTDKKYGDSSAYLTGSNQYIYHDNHADFQMQASDFTMEAYVNVSGGSGPRVIFGKAASFNQSYYLYYDGGAIAFSYTTDGSSGSTVSTTYATTLTVGQWYHVAVSRQGSNLYLFLDGALVATRANVPTWFNSSDAFRIGSIGVGGYEYFWNGYIDEVRITKGVCRYTTSFSPPIAFLNY